MVMLRDVLLPYNTMTPLGTELTSDLDLEFLAICYLKISFNMSDEILKKKMTVDLNRNGWEGITEIEQDMQKSAY